MTQKKIPLIEIERQGIIDSLKGIMNRTSIYDFEEIINDCISEIEDLDLKEHYEESQLTNAFVKALEHANVGYFSKSLKHIPDKYHNEFASLLDAGLYELYIERIETFIPEGK